MTKIDFNNDSVKHKRRVMSLGAHKRRTRAMLDFLKEQHHQLNESQITRYTHCHNYLLFRHYPVLQKLNFTMLGIVIYTCFVRCVLLVVGQNK